MKRQKKISSLYDPKYINKDSANYIKSAISTGQEELNKYDVTHGLYRFGEITVSTHSIPVVLNVSALCTKEYMKEWNADTGRFFCTDLRRGNKDLYYEITTSLVRALVRQISPEEASDDEFAKFQKVLIGEFEYAIIKVVNVDSNYMAEDVNTCELKDLTEEKERVFNEELEAFGVYEDGYSQNDEPMYLDESLSTEFDFSDDDDE